MAKFDAIAQAAFVRFRPIVMTTSTPVLGLLPMATAVVAGLISATVLTLVIIPTVYSLVDRGD